MEVNAVKLSAHGLVSVLIPPSESIGRFSQNSIFFVRHNPAFSSYLYIEANVCFNCVHINNELSKLN